MVQGLVMAGIVAGAALVTNQIITDQKLAQKGAETRGQLEDLHHQIYTLLQSGNICYSTMVNNNYLVVPQDTNLELTHGIINENGSKYEFVPGNAYINNNIFIKNMFLLTENPANPGQRILEISYQRLMSDFSRRTKSGFGAKHIRKTLNIRFQHNPNTGEFMSCSALQTNNELPDEMGTDVTKVLCEEMAGTSPDSGFFVWDDVHNVCVPQQCPSDKLFVGIDSNGNLHCKDIEKWMDLNVVLDQTPAQNCTPGFPARFNINNTTKKVKIHCGPMVAVPLQIDCVGSWGPCNHILTPDQNCDGTQVYNISVLPENGGASCPYNDGDSQQCKVPGCCETLSKSPNPFLCGVPSCTSFTQICMPGMNGLEWESVSCQDLDGSSVVSCNNTSPNGCCESTNPHMCICY